MAERWLPDEDRLAFWDPLAGQLRVIGWRPGPAGVSAVELAPGFVVAVDHAAPTTLTELVVPVDGPSLDRGNVRLLVDLLGDGPTTTLQSLLTSPPTVRDAVRLSAVDREPVADAAGSKLRRRRRRLRRRPGPTPSPAFCWPRTSPTTPASPRTPGRWRPSRPRPPTSRSDRSSTSTASAPPWPPSLARSVGGPTSSTPSGRSSGGSRSDSVRRSPSTSSAPSAASTTPLARPPGSRHPRPQRRRLRPWT